MPTIGRVDDESAEPPIEAANSDNPPVPASQPSGAPRTAFEIYLAWADVTLHVPPTRSALDVLLEAGVEIEPGCQTGGCGMCVTAYVEGDVVHADGCLTAQDRSRYFCPCVSRARTRIVLAL